MPQEHVYAFSAPLNFPRTLAYIGRYELAQRAAVSEGVVYQVLADERGYFLVRIRAEGKQKLAAAIITGRATKARDALLDRFVRRAFGPDDVLLAFYRNAKRDPVLAAIVRRFRGVRLVGVVNLWECLGWSIIGQQVSVASAFAMRARLVRAAGAVVEWNGTVFEGFPTPVDLLKMSGEQMRECGLSRSKVDYLRGIADTVQRGLLKEEEICALPYDEARMRLRALRGIGPWSVEYAMMRAVGDPDACPVEDIGLRNAIAREYDLGHQATLDETVAITDLWKPYRAYGSFYLWQTLW
ncbi:MAG TPA: hypothetical protein VGL38_01475 [bacterium]|jgi:DNA-3-methyladenine glycosylase II